MTAGLVFFILVLCPAVVLGSNLWVVPGARYSLSTRQFLAADERIVGVRGYVYRESTQEISDDGGLTYYAWNTTCIAASAQHAYCDDATAVDAVWNGREMIVCRFDTNTGQYVSQLVQSGVTVPGCVTDASQVDGNFVTRAPAVVYNVNATVVTTLPQTTAWLLPWDGYLAVTSPYSTTTSSPSVVHVASGDVVPFPPQTFFLHLGRTWPLALNSTAPCPPGTAAAVGGACVNCQPGTYQDTATWLPFCRPCPAGTFTIAEASLQCAPCFAASTWCPPGSQHPQPPVAVTNVTITEYPVLNSQVEEDFNLTLIFSLWPFAVVGLAASLVVAVLLHLYAPENIKHALRRIDCFGKRKRRTNTGVVISGYLIFLCIVIASVTLTYVLTDQNKRTLSETSVPQFGGIMDVAPPNATLSARLVMSEMVYSDWVVFPNGDSVNVGGLSFPSTASVNLTVPSPLLPQFAVLELTSVAPSGNYSLSLPFVPPRPPSYAAFAPTNISCLHMAVTIPTMRKLVYDTVTDTTISFLSFNHKATVSWSLRDDESHHILSPPTQPPVFVDDTSCGGESGLFHLIMDIALTLPERGDVQVVRYDVQLQSILVIGVAFLFMYSLIDIVHKIFRAGYRWFIPDEAEDGRGGGGGEAKCEESSTTTTTTTTTTSASAVIRRPSYVRVGGSGG